MKLTKQQQNDILYSIFLSLETEDGVSTFRNLELKLRPYGYSLQSIENTEKPKIPRLSDIINQAADEIIDKMEKEYVEKDKAMHWFMGLSTDENIKMSAEFGEFDSKIGAYDVTIIYSNYLKKQKSENKTQSLADKIEEESKPKQKAASIRPVDGSNMNMAEGKPPIDEVKQEMEGPTEMGSSIFSVDEAINNFKPTTRLPAKTITEIGVEIKEELKQKAYERWWRWALSSANREKITQWFGKEVTTNDLPSLYETFKI